MIGIIIVVGAIAAIAAALAEQRRWFEEERRRQARLNSDPRRSPEYLPPHLRAPGGQGSSTGARTQPTPRSTEPITMPRPESERGSSSDVWPNVVLLSLLADSYKHEPSQPPVHVFGGGLVGGAGAGRSFDSATEQSSTSVIPETDACSLPAETSASVCTSEPATSFGTDGSFDGSTCDGGSGGGDAL